MLGFKGWAGAAVALGMLAFGTGAPMSAPAAEPPTTTATTTEAAYALDYWTADQLKSARPKILTTSRTFSPGAASAASSGPSEVVPGAPASLPYNPSLAQQLVAPESANQEGVEPSAVGSTGQRYPYTISRLYPCVGSNCPSSGTFSNIWDFYPYTIVGQLFFTEPGVGNFVCSASVIRLSVIATAGHCVSDGHSHFYTNWLFIPAYHEGLAPFGRFTWCEATTTTNWFSGGGTVPNKQDDALIVLSNPEASNGSASCASTRSPKIGNLTGYLGYEFNAPLPTHLTQLGYPCNLDSCSDPIRDDSQVFSGPNGNFEWGTAAFGGASGGPEIQDFGQPLKGGPPPTLAFGGNILISSTSYTYTNTAVQVDGGSILQPAGFPGNGFGDLINTVCGTSGHPTGNC